MHGTTKAAHSRTMKKYLIGRAAKDQSHSQIETSEMLATACSVIMLVVSSWALASFLQSSRSISLGTIFTDHTEPRPVAKAEVPTLATPKT